MHKTFIAMAIGAALGSAGAAASSSAATLQAHQVTAGGVAFGAPDATTFAYTTDGAGATAAVTLRGDDGRIRTVAAPAGCRLTGAGAGVLAGLCGRTDAAGTSTLDLFTQRLDGTVADRITAVVTADNANAFGPGGPLRAGTRWLALPNGAKDDPDGWITVVDRRTGEAHDVHGRDLDARQYVDLDATTPTAKLCAPLKRATVDPLGVDVRGRWALVKLSGTRSALRRCGTSKPAALPTGFRPRALGDGWVAGVTPVAGHAARLDLVRLSDRRRFSVTGVPAARKTLTITRGRVYAYQSGSPGISTIKLPQR